MKRNSLLSKILTLILTAAAAVSVFSCKKTTVKDGDKKPSAGEVTGSVAQAREVVNRSMEELESSFGSVTASARSRNRVSGALAVPKPYPDNYRTKAAALFALYDVYQGQYQVQYVMNYALAANDYPVDLELGKIYSTRYMADGLYAYIRVLQTNTGVNFRIEIPVENYGGMTVRYQYDFDYNYDYETSEPRSMSMYLTQYNKISQSENVVEDVGVYFADINFETNEVNYLQFVTDCNDGGKDFYAKMNAESFDCASFESSNLKAYFVENVSLDPDKTDYFVYNYGVGSGSSDSAQTDIDETFRSRYASVYDKLKGRMHTREFLDVSDAISMGDELYDNMYKYSSSVTGNMDTSGGNVEIKTIRSLETAKSICAAVKTQLDENPIFDSGYTKAKSVIAAACEYLDTINQSRWFGILSADGKIRFSFNAGVYTVNYPDRGAGIDFTIDNGGNVAVVADTTVSDER